MVHKNIYWADLNVNFVWDTNNSKHNMKFKTLSGNLAIVLPKVLRVDLQITVLFLFFSCNSLATCKDEEPLRGMELKEKQKKSNRKAAQKDPVR